MRVAIITGAGSGIGRATAMRLAKGAAEPFALVLIGRTAQTLDRTAEEIRKAGAAEVLVAVGDVSNPDEAESLVHRAVEKFGRVDVLINNAGSAPSITLRDLSPRQWRSILDTNLSSAVYLTHAVWPLMQRQFEKRPNPPADSVIVNISSIASKEPFPGLGPYAVAKAGINMLSLVTAREGSPFGIRCVAIAPGAVDTQMLHNLMGAHPLPQDMMLQPDDVARMVCDVVGGSLRHCSGDTLFIHRKPS